MNLGVFLAIGESIRDFKNKGQDKLLINYNFKTYSENFDKVYVFSYENERYTFFSNVIVLPNKYKLPRYFYSIFLPFFYPKEIISGDIFRGLQITGGLPGIITKLFFRKKIIINYGYPYSQVANLEGKKLQAVLYKIVERIVLFISNRVIVTSPEIKRYLGWYHQKTVLIPNGVDTKVFKCLPNIKKRYTVIFVGRLEKQKNLSTLINALSLLDKKDRDVLFIGNGSLRATLKKLAKNKKVNLKILEKIPHNLLPRYYNQAKIFVLPSFIEGHPKALLEAMSCSLPVIGNDIKGITSIIKDSENGLLFSNTTISLKEKISCILDNQEMAKKIAKNARTYVNKYFNYQKLKLKEIELLKRK